MKKKLLLIIVAASIFLTGCSTEQKVEGDKKKENDKYSEIVFMTSVLSDEYSCKEFLPKLKKASLNASYAKKIEANFQIGVCNHKLGRYEDAIDAFKQVTQDTPGWVNAKYNLGMSYYRAHKWQKAIETFQACLETGSKNENVFMMLGINQMKIGAEQEATENIEKAIELIEKNENGGKSILASSYSLPGEWYEIYSDDKTEPGE